MRLKRLLAQGENALHAVCASEADWLRDGFGPDAGFTAFVAEDFSGVIGMATCSARVITGWNGPVIFLQDLFVEPHCRQLGVASALMARVAALARDVGSPIVELTVRADNPAQNFYLRSGFAAAAALHDLRSRRARPGRARRSAQRERSRSPVDPALAVKRCVA